jgi:hypothetical protein
VRSRPRGCRDEDFGGWWFVAERAVWPERVIEAAPALDDDACLGQHVEDLAVEQFIAQPGIDGVDGACTLPGLQ